ncbi:flagellar basal-body MS-ring/collar protein FliF [Nitratireductor sp. StC3]|uniref:flagellar basal-body MS-ring/collar protein FliF n=1 Tax=Nitratireductor sp. StC3 TaxID=2126741 RepID=UPI000D0CBF29|nr:flagellar basal-body MS-ring/collar protein FliF [Nitratireductor sp. StC3]PSM18867.1 flagellar M-ring protein FliF [Nitratireductor sp. StC3]
MPEQLQKIADNLKALGTQRLIVMGGMAALVMAVITVASLYLNRPAMETLYVGLDRGDVNRIGVVLGEAGVTYDIGAEGASVLVSSGQAGRARMILAEKGLPASSNAGYELFDNVGSLGLTSFMQEVTRVRALEGEIARTIQSIAGIKSARVHIVMAEQANFRRGEQKPTASVVIRTGGVDATRSANSIRHLVSAAVPGLTADNVTVLDADGSLLAAGEDPTTSSLNQSISIQRTVESQIADNIYRALSPYLGHENFRASVKAVVNTDSRQIEETIFDPDSRVERSIQIIRENDNSNKSTAAAPASVEQNLPDEDTGGATTPQSSEERERKEEITNYELNSKRIATVSNGYSISRLSIAVVVNRERLATVLGEGATPEMVEARVAEIQQVVSTAAGLDEERGDKINVTALSFVDAMEAEAAAAPGYLEIAAHYTGSMVNALAFIVVAFLVSWFGLRPLAGMLTKKEDGEAPNFEDLQLSIGSPLDNIALPDPLAEMAPNENDVMEELKMRLRPAPQERLAQMVDLNEERTAAILRKWTQGESVGEAMAG